MSTGLTSSQWAADAFVTAANPAPGRVELQPYYVTSGTGYETRYVTTSDGGIGLNVYVAGGTGPSGVLPVSQTNPAQISLSGVSISGIIEVTTSAGNPLLVTGSVSLQPSGVYVQNLPATQTVALDSPVPLPVTGSVGVVGTATVAIDPSTLPLQVSGARIVSLTSTVTQYMFPNTVLSVLPPNPSRVRFNIYNDGDQRLLIRLGPSASLSGWDTRIPSSGYYESPFPCWCGEVTVLGQNSGTGFIYVGEQM